MKFTFTSDQLSRLKKAVLRLKSQADRDVVENRRQISFHQGEAARLTQNQSGLLRRLTAVSRAYDNLINAYGNWSQEFDLEAVKNDAEVSAILAEVTKPVIYFVRSRTGGRTHTVTLTGDNVSCDCTGGSIRGYCWASNGVKAGVKRNPFTGADYIRDDKGVERTIIKGV